MQAVRITTGYCYDTRMQAHHPLEEDPGDRHPEQPERILSIYNRMTDSNLDRRMARIAVREAVQEEVMLVHSEQHWDRIRRMAFFPDIHILATKEYYNRLSLYLSRDSALCARLSCGGVIETCRAVWEGRIRNAFAIVRPPGHHAEPEQEMGFCFFNNVAVAAKWLKLAYQSQGLKKVLILDWDVHHGNGTQRAFWSDPDVLYISIHMFNRGLFYPGGPFGGADQCGEGEGLGTSVNIPWNDSGMGDAEYIYAFQRVVMPIAHEFNPDFVVVSAGYDAAMGDQLGGCKVTPAGFGHMTQMLSSLANGKLVLALEGGYDVTAISTSAVECIKVLLGDLPPQLPALKARAEATAVVNVVATEQSRYWKSVEPTLQEPRNVLGSQAAEMPVAQLLKAHRAYHFFEKNLINVELTDPTLREMYRDQVFCSKNVYNADTLVVHLHDIGVIHPQLGSRSYDVHGERDFILAEAERLRKWTISNEFGLIDVNVMSRTPEAPITRVEEERIEASLAVEVWKQFVLPSKAKNVVFIGLSAGCAALTAVINRRYSEVKRRLRASIMIPGLQKPPTIEPADPTRSISLADMQRWYATLSRVICPITFNLLEPDVVAQKPHGELVDTDEPRALQACVKHWATVDRFIMKQLGRGRLANGV